MLRPRAPVSPPPSSPCPPLLTGATNYRGLLVPLETKSTEGNPSRDANSHSANGEIPCLYGTKMFTTVLVRARWFQCTSHKLFFVSFLILSSHQSLWLSCSLFSRDFSIKLQYAFLFFETRSSCDELPLQYLIWNTIRPPSEVCRGSFTSVTAAALCQQTAHVRFSPRENCRDGHILPWPELIHIFENAHCFWRKHKKFQTEGVN
jgi:hypothetical protein